MSKPFTVKTIAEPPDDAPVRRADLAAGRLLLPNKQRVNLFLDGAVVEHFRALAGARGYQTLINEALKQSMRAESIETVVRQAIREELRRG